MASHPETKIDCSKVYVKQSSFSNEQTGMFDGAFALVDIKEGELVEKGVMRRLPEGFDGNTCPYIFTWSTERPNKVNMIWFNATDMGMRVSWFVSGYDARNDAFSSQAMMPWTKWWGSVVGLDHWAHILGCTLLRVNALASVQNASMRNAWGDIWETFTS